MPEATKVPGQTRPNAQANFDEAKRQIARRNEEAQRAARAQRDVREREETAKRRKRDLL
jgi:hypothetical protein